MEIPLGRILKCRVDQKRLKISDPKIYQSDQKVKSLTCGVVEKTVVSFSERVGTINASPTKIDNEDNNNGRSNLHSNLISDMNVTDRIDKDENDDKNDWK